MPRLALFLKSITEHKVYYRKPAKFVIMDNVNLGKGELKIRSSKYKNNKVSNFQSPVVRISFSQNKY